MPWEHSAFANILNRTGKGVDGLAPSAGSFTAKQLS
jgi:hypothetical protein